MASRSTPAKGLTVAVTGPTGEIGRSVIEAALEAGGIRTVPDPIDRLLIATARQADATLVTADRRILDYGKSAYGCVVHDARR